MALVDWQHCPEPRSSLHVALTVLIGAPDLGPQRLDVVADLEVEGGGHDGPDAPLDHVRLSVGQARVRHDPTEHGRQRLPPDGDRPVGGALQLRRRGGGRRALALCKESVNAYACLLRQTRKMY